MATHDDERIDFSALDPTTDSLRFERMVRGLSARALAQREASTPAQLVHWWRPALALAASVCLVTWASLWVGGTGSGPVASQAEIDPVETLSGWAQSGATASMDEVLGTLGRL